MYFKLRTDARKWFADIRKSMELDFDMYYLCLMIGLKKLRRNTNTSLSSTDLTESFPGVYENSSKLLIALLLHKEVELEGVSLENRETINNRIIARFISSNSPNKLSDTGVKEMNSFASGGFDELNEIFNEKPRIMETFLRQYYQTLDAIKPKK